MDIKVLKEAESSSFDKSEMMTMELAVELSDQIFALMVKFRNEANGHRNDAMEECWTGIAISSLVRTITVICCAAPDRVTRVSVIAGVIDAIKNSCESYDKSTAEVN